MKIIIKPKKITRKNFQKFGDLISLKKKKFININDGYAKRFDNLCRINTSSKKGKTIMSIFSAKKRKFPMNETTFLVFVAPKGKRPNTKKIESFIVPKQTGINYKPGIWHFPLISSKNMNFLVIDRKGIGNNLVIHNFKNEKISLKYK